MKKCNCNNEYREKFIAYLTALGVKHAESLADMSLEKVKANSELVRQVQELMSYYYYAYGGTEEVIDNILLNSEYARLVERDGDHLKKPLKELKN